jgi:glycosyltransferase involved in cell wall biosynthesis
MLVLSVIVPTCNRPKLLAECLSRLSPDRQSLSANCYEVIVSDDGRDAAARSQIAQVFPWAKFVEGPARGPAANRNHGASLAKTNWLVFIDDDCLPCSDILQAYVDALSAETGDNLTAYVGPTIRTSDPESLLWEAPHSPLGRDGISANFAMKKEVLQGIGEFDERYPFAFFEDTEFFSRLFNMGGKITEVPAATAHHPLRRIGSPKKLAKRWEGRVIHGFDQGASVAVLAWRVPWHVLRVIQSRFRGQSWSRDNRTAAWIFFREWLWVMVYTPFWIAKWSRRPRNPFWKNWVDEHGPYPRYGF